MYVSLSFRQSVSPQMQNKVLQGPVRAHWLPLHGHPLQSISLQLNGHKISENKSSSLQNLSNITASDTYANP